MKNILTFSMLAVATLLVSNVSAQDAAEKSNKVPVAELAESLAGETCTKDCCHGCPIEAAMNKLPKMAYRVGTEDLCCPDSAAKLAEENKTKVHFVVGEKVFEDETEAFTSLVEQTEAMVNDFVTPSKCEKSGTHTIAGTSCKCEVQAGKNAELVKNAINNIKMTYAVGEKSCNCPNEAGSLAKSSGEKMTYVVGEEKTCCNMTARLNLAKAKYKAAVEALATAQKADTKETSATQKAAANNS